MIRITSYNVCYTKLLRFPPHDSRRCVPGPGRCFRQPARLQVPDMLFVPVEFANLADKYQRRSIDLITERKLLPERYNSDVITSYSIHYTKLYESSKLRLLDPKRWSYQNQRFGSSSSSSGGN